MVQVVLFHHIQGLTPGVEAFADALRRAGHEVQTPDMFEGNTFASIEEGMEYAEEHGFGVLAQRGVDAVEGMPQGLVYAGFSFGVMPAQQLAQTRPGARGAVFIDSCLPVSEFGDGWPDGVPVQIHGMDEDDFFAAGGDLEAARELVGSADDAELFLYSGDKHLFGDSSVATYEAEAAELLKERVVGFLDRLD